jgi:hypothetical protein
MTRRGFDVSDAQAPADTEDDTFRVPLGPADTYDGLVRRVGWVDGDFVILIAVAEGLFAKVPWTGGERRGNEPGISLVHHEGKSDEPGSSTYYALSLVLALQEVPPGRQLSSLNSKQ